MFHVSQFLTETRIIVSRGTVSTRNIIFGNMKRKKWTPKEDVTEAVLKFREKRKWQIALRRYILEKNPCTSYAPYFGLDILRFRKWIELQFDQDSNWENFGSVWQFEHIIPVIYFDFKEDDDLKLCWNFINIRVERIVNNDRGNPVDVLAAKSYFKELFNNTGYLVCLKMLEKITMLEFSQVYSNKILETFIKDNIDYVQTLATFTSYEFSKLNQGESFSDILLEKEILKKFGR